MRKTLPERRALLRQAAERLASCSPLLPEHLQTIEHLAGETTLHRRGADLEAALAEGPHFILAGWACHMRALADGGRQIFCFLLPGDVAGSFRQAPASPPAARTVALTPLETLAASPLVVRDPGGAPTDCAIARAGRRAEDQSRSLLFDHIVRLGARDAYVGVAHLLLELHGRLSRVGLAEDGGFHLPVGQRVLAQAMGLSAPHLNHTLQRLAADGLVEARGATMRLLQPERMAELADFEGAAPVA